MECRHKRADATKGRRADATEHKRANATKDRRADATEHKRANATKGRRADATEHKRAGGAEFVSPALQRGEKGFHKFVTESRRDGARTLFMQQPISSGENARG